MGLYLEPPNGDKPAFLREHGKPIPLSEVKDFDDWAGDSLPVVLLDNGIFYAAGVAFNPRETDAFTRPEDLRPKQGYMVSKAILEVHCPAWELYMKK